MKIEIELSEVEHLRSQLRQSEQQVMELEKKLKDLSEPELKKKAINLSYRLLNNYMGTIFEHLGLGEWNGKDVVVKDNLEHWIGGEWWKSDRITIELGAEVTTKFKSAFLSIGILPKKEAEKTSDDVYKLI